MAGYSTVYINSYMSRSEREIYTLFNRYAIQLYDRKWELLKDITNWRDTQNRLIEEHASKQRSLLEQEYHKQVTYMEDLRQQYIAAAGPHEQARNNEQINQLLSQCQALKIELADFGYSDRSIPFIEFMNEEQRARKKQNERKAERTEDSKSRSNVAGDYDYYNTNNAAAYGSATPNQALTTSNQGNRPGSGTTHTSAAYADSNSNTKGDGDLIPKCPTCFMIFPSHMLLNDRQQHVEEHFKDS